MNSHDSGVHTSTPKEERQDILPLQKQEGRRDCDVGGLASSPIGSTGNDVVGVGSSPIRVDRDVGCVESSPIGSKDREVGGVESNPNGDLDVGGAENSRDSGIDPGSGDAESNPNGSINSGVGDAESNPNDGINSGVGDAESNPNGGIESDIGGAKSNPNGTINSDIGGAQSNPNGTINCDIGGAERNPNGGINSDVGSAESNPNGRISSNRSQTLPLGSVNDACDGQVIADGANEGLIHQDTPDVRVTEGVNKVTLTAVYPNEACPFTKAELTQKVEDILTKHGVADKVRADIDIRSVNRPAPDANTFVNKNHKSMDVSEYDAKSSSVSDNYYGKL